MAEAISLVSGLTHIHDVHVSDTVPGEQPEFWHVLERKCDTSACCPHHIRARGAAGHAWSPGELVRMQGRERGTGVTLDQSLVVQEARRAPSPVR